MNAAGPTAAPASIDWMLRTRTQAQVMADAAQHAPTLEDIAWDHLALLQMLAWSTAQPTAFCGQIARTSRALGLGG